MGWSKLAAGLLPSCSLTPPLSRREDGFGRSGMRKFVGWDKDEIACQISSWAKQTQLGEIKLMPNNRYILNYWFKYGEAKRQILNDIEKTSSFPPFPGLTSFQAPVLLLLLSPKVTPNPFINETPFFSFFSSAAVQVLHRLQGTSALPWRISSSDANVPSAVSHTFCALVLSIQHFLPFLKYIFAEAPHT